MKNRLKINDNTVVHCTTEELANKVLAIADRLGYKWCNDKIGSFLDNNYWNNFKEDTCYNLVEGMRGAISDYRQVHRTIISAEDFLKLHNEEVKSEKPILYYIRGVEDRGEEVIKMLESKGGVNKHKLEGKGDSVYYIGKDNLITTADYEDDLGIMVTIFGTELFLPEKLNKYGIKPFDRVLVRDSVDCKWRCSIFFHMDEDKTYPYECCNKYWNFCIPYEGNEHLLGTTNNSK